MCLTKFTVTTTLSLLSLGIIYNNPANACTLWIGSYGSFVRDINLVGFITTSDLKKQRLNTVNQKQLEKEDLINKIDALASAEPLKEQIEKDYNYFDTQIENNSSSVEADLSNDSTEIAYSEKVNRNIEKRYQNLIDDNSDKINLVAANKLVEGMTEDSIEELAENKRIKSVLEPSSISDDSNVSFSKYQTAGIYLAVFGSGFLVLIPILKAFGGSEIGKFFSRDKVPETAIV